MTGLEAIRAVRERIRDAVLETPLVRLDAPEAPCELWLAPHQPWWQTMVERSCPGVAALFVHPVEDEPVIAANKTIGLEPRETP